MVLVELLAVAVGTIVVVGVERDGGGPFGLARCRHVTHACDMVGKATISC
jgi:hypothetical protein